MQQPSKLFIISLLGSLSIISPFAIDMYLAAFPQLAESFDVPSTMISLTLSSYFIGLAFGQIFYGPLLDRFGRKPPLIAGLIVFILMSIACTFAPNIYALIAMRFIQAFGGCVAGVASLTMTHDFFPGSDRAKILSRLFLFIAVSPLLAPTIGGMIVVALGWKAVFVILAAIVGVIVTLIYTLLPEGHTPDKTISLKPLPIMREYWTILQHPRFITYALAGAFSFAGLFTYVAGSPVIFMDGFGVSAETYSMIFALLTGGFIAGSQVNVWLLKRMSSETIFMRMVMLQVVIAVVFVIGSWQQWWGLPHILALFFLFLSCVGISYPNAAALALMPFHKNAGSASAMLGFLQLGIGAAISTGIGFFNSKDSFPIIALLAVTSILGLIVLLIGKKSAETCVTAEPEI